MSDKPHCNHYTVYALKVDKLELPPNATVSLTGYSHIGQEKRIMIVLTGTFIAQPDASAKLIALAKTLVPLSRQEPGCMRYDFLLDPLTPGRFVFFELWRSRDLLNAHFQQSYFKNFADQLPSLIVGDAEILTYESEDPVSAF